ncbi:peptidoglycan-binding protein [Luteimonas sp. A649]
MENGVFVAGQKGRVHAYIDGRLEEIEIPRRTTRGEFRDYDLGPDQVLLKKDLILSRPDHDPSTRLGRSVDVPSPVAGFAGARRDREGLVDVLDKPGGEVIARFRHMSDIRVNPGDRVEYGQALGVQDNVGTGPIHVHMEMDTRYYQQFRNYIDDLTSGRLPMEAEHRENVQARAVVDDGTLRLGESSVRIRDLQMVMDGEGYRAASGRPLDLDGVYRLGMQGPLLDFQRAHGIPQTGSIDPATLRFAPPLRTREIDRLDHTEGGRFPPVDRKAPNAPGHPDHPDHRSKLPVDMEPAINQRRAQAFPSCDPQLDRLMTALRVDDDGAISRVCAEIARSPDMQALLAQGRETLTAEQASERRQPEMVRDVQAPVLSHC